MRVTSSSGSPAPKPSWRDASVVSASCLLEDAPLAVPDSDAIQAAMLRGLRTLGLAALPWTPALEQWRARVVFAA